MGSKNRIINKYASRFLLKHQHLRFDHSSHPFNSPTFSYYCLVTSHSRIMLGQHSSRVLGLVLGLWTFLCHGASVYRADARGFGEIQTAGGFAPKGSLPGALPFDVSLWNHVNDQANEFDKSSNGYVFTSLDRNQALNFLKTSLKGTGNIYKIAVAPNLIDVEATLGKFYTNNKKELAALGGIKWEQIESYTPFTNGIEGFQANFPGFDPSKWANKKSGGGQPQLAAFPAGHEAWGQDPWKQFATCSAKATCTPKKTALGAALDYFDSIKI